MNAPRIHREPSSLRFQDGIGLQTYADVVGRLETFTGSPSFYLGPARVLGSHVPPPAVGRCTVDWLELFSAGRVKMRCRVDDQVLEQPYRWDPESALNREGAKKQTLEMIDDFLTRLELLALRQVDERIEELFRELEDGPRHTQPDQEA